MNDISMQINNPRWNPIYVISAGTTEEQLQKEVYKEIRQVTGAITNHLVCYSWGTQKEIKYCGSVARTYQHGGYSTPLEGRVHNYFKNHKKEENGRKNANLNVYEHIRETLVEEDVVLAVLAFDRITLGEKVFTYEEYSKNPELIQAVELMLICYYKEIGQSPWNRTPSTRFLKPKQVNLPKPMHVRTGSHSMANEIRAYIIQKYINPCKKNGVTEVKLHAGTVHKELGLSNSFPSVCQVIDGQIFQNQAGVELITRKGPLKSSSVEWLFRIKD